MLVPHVILATNTVSTNDILISNCDCNKPEEGKERHFSSNLIPGTSHVKTSVFIFVLLKADVGKCTSWHTVCFCFVLWGYVGSGESVKVKRAECSHCTLAAFFTMVTLSSQAHSSSLTASRAQCAQGPLSQALNHWTEILWQLVSTARHSWMAGALTAAFVDSVLFLLTSHICGFLQGEGCSDFWWRSGSDKQQCQYCELHLR